ncbi:hypothetical protein AK812_SmicGene17855 [Symbiodinium microadriaticum]|uniref:Uncharacterized protein n=1 Tax=Symbiodinium microadriaticum TaxID=2951 RepID=A0A1Q9DWL7_SYMMI|nr:hypothetical protein AK812_SmicGene17855 [Symbiodinium microadriaticum]
MFTVAIDLAAPFNQKGKDRDHDDDKYLMIVNGNHSEGEDYFVIQGEKEKQLIKGTKEKKHEAAGTRWEKRWYKGPSMDVHRGRLIAREDGGLTFAKSVNFNVVDVRNDEELRDLLPPAIAEGVANNERNYEGQPAEEIELQAKMMLENDEVTIEDIREIYVELETLSIRAWRKGKGDNIQVKIKKAMLPVTFERLAGRLGNAIFFEGRRAVGFTAPVTWATGKLVVCRGWNAGTRSAAVVQYALQPCVTGGGQQEEDDQRCGDSNENSGRAGRLVRQRRSDEEEPVGSLGRWALPPRSEVKGRVFLEGAGCRAAMLAARVLGSCDSTEPAANFDANSDVTAWRRDGYVASELLAYYPRTELDSLLTATLTQYWTSGRVSTEIDAIAGAGFLTQVLADLQYFAGQRQRAPGGLHHPYGHGGRQRPLPPRGAVHAELHPQPALPPSLTWGAILGNGSVIVDPWSKAQSDGRFPLVATFNSLGSTVTSIDGRVTALENSSGVAPTADLTVNSLTATSSSRRPCCRAPRRICRSETVPTICKC